MSQAVDELSVIEPIAESVPFRGAEVRVEPLKVGQLAAFARALRGMSVATILAAGRGDPGALFTLVTEHGDQIIEACAIATRQTRESIEQADTDEFILLAATVIRVNLDFFVRRLPAMLEQAARVRGLVANGDGPTRSTP